jgi:hypothetical protein
MGLVDGVINGALVEIRKLLGVIEDETEDVLPVKDIEEIQTRVLGSVEAIRDATDQIEAHAAALESLIDTLPVLTNAVQDLTKQLGVIAEVLAPVVGAEREMSRLRHLLGRHRPAEPAPRTVPSPGPPTLHG